MTTPREEVAAQITADHPNWRVTDYPYKPSNVTPRHPVATVLRTSVTPASSALTLTHTVQVTIIGAGTVGKETETGLDDLLDAVYLSVERMPGYRVTKAERASLYGDTFSGWVVDVEATSANVYRQTIQKESRS